MSGAPERIERAFMEQLMLGAGRVRRFTQDTPVLPDVWLAYANCLDDGRPTPRWAERDPHPPIKLLLTPYRQTSVGAVRTELVSRLAADLGRQKRVQSAGAPNRPTRVVYNQTTVGAELSFAELIRAALPMTHWWRELAERFETKRLDDLVDELAFEVADPEHPRPLPARKGQARRLPPGLLWMMRVVGALALITRGEELPWPSVPRPESGRRTGKPDPGWRRLVVAVADLIRDLPPGRPDAPIYAINLNREVSPTIAKSTLAVKADAARKLFELSCSKLAWAIVDAGVDARHPAFRVRGAEDSAQPSKRPAKKELASTSRVVRTYDFTRVDRLLDPTGDRLPENLKGLLDQEGKPSGALQERLEELRDAIRDGRSIDWGRIAPLLEIPHDRRYVPPGNDHGTHVAGILAADWPKAESGGALEEDMVGVCRDLKLYDLRVLDADGRGDEFAVMAALQFVRHLNAAHDYVVVHGVNLSLSIPHDVANYACGRTPVCDECERLVASGVVVVAAAGNQGYRRYATAEGGKAEAYNNSSITDPGNADAVITVGATHRYRAHTYGVSYFSSRGPTGDGRAKPDLVAPGEKIEAPLPDELFGPKDGTSMAAPHVSGGAALLMARYDELVGDPVRIKQILRATATDLGRERYFQGAGMLDILRALQSV